MLTSSPNARLFIGLVGLKGNPISILYHNDIAGLISFFNFVRVGARTSEPMVYKKVLFV